MSNQAPPGGNQPPGGSPPPPPSGGYPPPGGYQGGDQDGYQQQPKRGSGMAIAALILGVLALLSCWTIIGGIMLGLIAVVLGIIGSGRAKRGQASGRGLAITGIVTGLLGIAGAVAIIALGVSIYNSDEAQGLRDCLEQADTQDAIAQCEKEFQDQVGSSFSY